MEQFGEPFPNRANIVEHRGHRKCREERHSVEGSRPLRRPTREDEAEATALVDHLLVMQSNCYMNSVYGVCAAKAGLEDGKYELMGGSCIIDPKGKILAMTETRGDEVIAADCDLDEVQYGRDAIFDFGRHRRVEAYSLITSQAGIVEPPLLG